MTHKADQGFLLGLRDELRSERQLPGLTSGALIGIKEIIFALSIGSLIFSGDLAPYLAFGLGIALVTQIIMMIGIALGSSVSGVIGGLQDSPAVILAVITAAVVDRLSVASAEEQLATVLVSIAISALLTGVFLLALGAFRLGGLVRFIPYPVVGGFLAGTGWLLLQGSFGVMTGIPFSLANILLLFQSDLLVLWVPGVLLALALLFGQRRIDHFLTMPAILVGGIALFYLALLLTGMSLDQAVNRGFLLGGVSSEAIWQPLTPHSLMAANWPAILGQGGNIAVILLLSAIGLLLNASGIELAIRRDVEINRELRVAGLANILCGLGGGTVGYHALDLSTLSYRIGARGRLPGLLAGALCALVLFAGTPLLAFAPVPVLGGLLLFLGLDFLAEWVIDGWSRLSHGDYAVVLLILVVIALSDFLIGVGVGLVVTIVLFVLNYSRINIVHHALSGGEIKSNVERCTYHRRRLRELGQHIYVLELRGFIFFGTSYTLLEQIRARVADREQPQVRFIILDFRRVSGLDSSAVLCFVKARQLAEAQGIVLVLTHTSGQTSRLFEPGGLFDDDSGVRIFPDLDHGLEWCEDQLLEIEQVTLVDMPLTLRAQLVAGGLERHNAVRLSDFLERVEVKEGDYLIRQGDEANDLFFIERGMVSIYLELGGGHRVRLQKLGVGTVVGELGLYLGTNRTASVIADWPTVAYRLTQAALSEMKEKEPELAAAFHEYAARFLSERLVATNRSLEAVLR